MRWVKLVNRYEGRAAGEDSWRQGGQGGLLETRKTVEKFFF
jgi:hypothetical protein